MTCGSISTPRGCARTWPAGIRSGVNGTPTFYINGVRHDAPYDLENLLAAVNAAAHGRA